MKTFNSEILKLFKKFKEGKPFAFCKFCDGEWMAMNGDQLNNNEFKNDPNQSYFYRGRLIEALQYKDPNYYIGVSCQCCWPDHNQKMKDLSGQDEDHLTFANIFVNSNYNTYKNTFLKEFEKYDVHLVANKNSRIENLPFKVEKFYPVGFNAWVVDYNLIEEIKKQNLKNKLFLFSCGPFGNILTHQLYHHNKDNIYLDIGSTLNPWTQSEGFERDYYVSHNGIHKNYLLANRSCIW